MDKAPHMETIQVVLDAKLLRAADKAARRSKLNRSALVRNALREHLRQLAIRDLEDRDRKGYQGGARNIGEFSIWESEAVWPEY